MLNKHIESPNRLSNFLKEDEPMPNSEAKQNVIDAAMRVLTDCSIEDVTMRNIAKEAGVTTGSIYHHYKNKDDLIFDVMQQSLHFTKNLYETAESENLESNELFEEVKRQVDIRIKKVAQQRLHIQLFSYMLNRKSIIKENYNQAYKEMIESTKQLMLKAYDIDDHINVDILSSVLVAAVDGIAMQQTLEVLPCDLETYSKVFNEFFSKFLYTYLK